MARIVIKGPMKVDNGLVYVIDAVLVLWISIEPDPLRFLHYHIDLF
jgi:hypothetical protein